MPFPTQDPRPFTRAGIQSIASDLIGIYGIITVRSQNDWVWVYVGKADDVRGRLLEHLGEHDPCFLVWQPTHFVAAITKSSERNISLEKELTLEYEPQCNQRVG